MNFFRYNIFWILWLILITYTSNKKSSELPKVSFLQFQDADKLVHFVFYFVLSFTMAYGFKKQNVYQGLKQYLFLLVFTLTVMWGGLMEFSQYYIFTYRSAEWLDLLANILGTMFGLVSVFIYFNHLLRKK